MSIARGKQYASCSGQLSITKWIHAITKNIVYVVYTLAPTVY